MSDRDLEGSATRGSASNPPAQALRGLDALNFFPADVRDGLGPCPAIYLIAVRGPDGGWNEATTGLVMTIAGHAGLIAQTPAGVTSVGQLLTKLSGKENATSLVAICIVPAQCVMAPVAAVVGARADLWGRKPIFLAAFGVLALCGVLYTLSDNTFYLVAVQCLDGIGAGIYGALFPILVADLTRGTGRFNVSQGAVAAAQGIGAALSASLAGLIIVSAGYGAAFLTLAGISAAGFALYLLHMPETVPAETDGT